MTKDWAELVAARQPMQIILLLLYEIFCESFCLLALLRHAELFHKVARGRTK